MRRIARVTEDLGRGAGGFYVEAADIPEGVTCNEWRARRAEVAADRSAFTWPMRKRRLA
jgi:hypothetical protein